MSFKTPLLTLFSAAILAGCASSPSEVEMMADHRASLLESTISPTYDPNVPLKLIKARSKGSVVNLEMLYNTSGQISPTTLMNNGVKVYCNEPEIRSVLNKGVIYNIIIRSERGKILVNQNVSEQTCTNLEDAS